MQRLTWIFLITMVAASVGLVVSEAADAIVIEGPEQGRVNIALPDGGLPPVIGAANIQLLRTTKDKPELAEGEGWTYAHHMDLAVWKGRLYAAWGMCPKDEDSPPYKILYATSSDGVSWTAPSDLFPRTVSWACRFYFGRALNGRMLAFCRGKNPQDATPGSTASVLVREIGADHQLGDVYTLVQPSDNLPPVFTNSADAGFVQACRQILDNHPLLEQQDYGMFLPVDQRIGWEANPPNQYGLVAGKAFCFYHREDGAFIGLSKMGFVTVTLDNGTNWSYPVIPPTLVAGAAKVWGQRTANGRYALVYNPAPDHITRRPLVVLNGEDGIRFGNMRVVHGECPRQRYQGTYKDPGPQYVRGLAEWSDDGSLPDRQALWMIYSQSKEDIWISRVPLPLLSNASTYPEDAFEQNLNPALVDGWNTYSPRWAPVRVVAETASATNHCLQLQDGDPYDYARAVRVFPASTAVTARLRVKPLQTDASLEIELADDAGKRPIRLSLTSDGRVVAVDGGSSRDLGSFAAGSWLALVLRGGANDFEITVNGTSSGRLSFAEPGGPLQRVSLRTGPWRGIGDGNFVVSGTDVPASNPAVFLVDDFAVHPTDSDDDGMRDWQEIIAGTDPSDATSSLRMAVPSRTSSGTILSWRSVTNRTYGLERSTNLLSIPVFMGIVSNLAGQGEWTFYTDGSASALGTCFYRVTVSAAPVNVSGSELWDGTANPHVAEGVTLTTEEINGRAYQVYTLGRGLSIHASGVITLGAANICLRFPPGSGGLSLEGAINLNRGTRSFAPINYFRLEMNDNNIAGAGDFIVDPGVNDCLATEIRGTGDVSFDEYRVSGSDFGTGGQLDVQIGGAFEARNLFGFDSADSGNRGRDFAIRARSIVVRGDILTYAGRTASPAVGGGNVILAALAYPAFDSSSALNTLSNAVTMRGQINANAAWGDAYDGSIAATGVVVTLTGPFNVPDSNTRAPEFRTGLPQYGKTAADFFIDQSTDARTYGATNDVQWGTQ
jgi:hypothetical protein